MRNSGFSGRYLEVSLEATFPDFRFAQTSATSENRSRKDSSFVVAEDLARGTRSLFCSALHEALKVDRAMLASKVTLRRAFAL
jgi:hypothetical protein